MQLMLILGIVFAIAAVLFALQNNVPVLVTLAVWTFEGSLALVLLIAVGLGVLITGLLSSPAAIRGQWVSSRLRRQVAELERQVAEQQGRNTELLAENERLAPLPVDAVDPVDAPKSYVGLRTLIAGDAEIAPPTERP